MKLTEPQRRMLRVMSDGESRPVWKMSFEAGSHASGYRVVAALYARGLITAPQSHSEPWYRITEAGRAALGAQQTENANGRAEA